MFSTERQHAAVCQRLCDLVGFPALFGPGGPTERGLALKRGGLGRLSHGERLMIQAAWDVWSGLGEMSFSDALAVLDGKNLRALGSLLVALADQRGAAAIDEWLDRGAGAAARERVVDRQRARSLSTP